MTLNKILLLSIISSMVVLTSCSRPESQVSKVRISVPHSLQSKNMNALETTDVLDHLVINVTVPGAAPVVYNDWGKCNGSGQCTFPSSFNISVERGSGRLIQVLAVYKSADRKMLFYYGDVKVDISSDAGLEIPIIKQGTSTETQGRIAGRFINSSGVGPTGPLYMKYKPEGKPSLIVEESHIMNGWFNIFALKDVNMTYELAGGALLFGQPININSPLFTPSNSVMKMHVPKHKRCHDNSCTFSEDENPLISVWGYFGSPGNKLICRDSISITRLKKPDNGALVPSYSITPPANLYTDTSGYIYFQGGVEAGTNGCPDVIDNQVFSNYLFVDSSLVDGNGNDAIAGFSPPLASSTFNGGTDRRPFHFDNSTNRLSGKILPGVENLIKSIKVFKTVRSDANTLESNDHFSCLKEKLDKNGFVAAGSSAISNLGFSVDTSITAADKSIGVAAAICFEKPDSTLMPLGMLLRADHFNSYTPPTGIITPTFLAHHFYLTDYNMGFKIPGGCYSTELRLEDNANAQVFLAGPDVVNYQIMVGNGSVGDAILYTDPSCTSPIGHVQNLSFYTGVSSKIFYYSPGVNHTHFAVNSSQVETPFGNPLINTFGSPFDPVFQPNLIMFLDPKILPPSGSITTWNFSSSNMGIDNGHGFTGRYMFASSTGPAATNIDGMNVISYTGSPSAELHNTSINLGRFTTVVLVKTPPSVSPAGCLISFGTVGEANYFCIKQFFSSTPQVEIFNGTTYQVTPLTAGWHVLFIRRDNTQAGQNRFALNVDNNFSFTYASYSMSLGEMPLTSIYIGNRSTIDSSTPFHIAEFMTFDRELNSSEAGMIYDYLKLKYPSFGLP